MATHNHNHDHGGEKNHTHPHNHKGDGKGGSDNHHGRGGNQKKGGNKGGDKDKNKNKGGDKNKNGGGKKPQITFDDIGQPIKLDEQALRERSQRETESSYAPLLQELDRQMLGARQDTDAQSEAIKNIYNQFGQAIAPLDNQANQQIGDIQGSYSQALHGLMGQLGTSESPAGELAAAGGLFANVGAGGLSELANAQSRNVSYNTSAERQGAIESTVARGNAQQDLSDQLELLRQQASDARQNQSRDTLNQLGTNRDTSFQQQLAQQELFLRQKALQAQVLSDKAARGYYTDLLGDKNKTGDGNNGDGNHNPGGRRDDNGDGNRDGNGNGTSQSAQNLLRSYTMGNASRSGKLPGQQQNLLQDTIKRYLMHNKPARPSGLGTRGVRNRSAVELMHLINRTLYNKRDPQGRGRGGHPQGGQGGRGRKF